MVKCLSSVTALATAGVLMFLLALPAEGEGQAPVRTPDEPRMKPEAPHGRREHGPGRASPHGARRPITQPYRRGLTETEEKELLAVLKKRRPEHYERLMQLRDSSPMRYRWMLRTMWHWYQRIKHLPEEIQDAAIAEMDSKVRAWRLAREYRRAASEGQKEQLLGELRKVVARQFDAEQKVRAHRLAALEEQLKRARIELKERSQERDRIIDDLVKRLIRHRARSSKVGAELRPAKADALKGAKKQLKRAGPPKKTTDADE